MWREVPIAALEAALAAPVLSVPEALADAALTGRPADSTRLPVGPWLQGGSLIERRSGYSRQKLIADPDSGGFSVRAFGILVRAERGHLLTLSPNPDWWPEDECSICLAESGYGLPGLVAAACWLLQALFPECQLGLPFLRQMANGVVLEGSAGPVERGVLLANSRGMSQDTAKLAGAGRYDIAHSAGVNVGSPHAAVATAIEELLAGRLMRVQLADGAEAMMRISEDAR